MNLFNTLLEITIYSAVIFVLIILFKTSLKDKISPIMHYAIWALLILRLLMPITINSGFNLIAIPQAVPDELIQNKSVIPENIVSDAHITPNSPIQQPNNTTPQTITNAQQLETAAINQMQAQKTLNTQEILIIIWLAGIGCSLAYFIISYLVLHKKVYNNSERPTDKLLALFEECKQNLEIKAKLKLKCQYDLSTPALLFPNIILMPMDLLAASKEEQIKFMLYHELMHYKHKDHLVCILLSLLRAVYWFNPVIWLAYFKIRTDMETACDNSVVSQFDKQQKITYANTILSMFSINSRHGLVLGMADTKRMAKHRIRGIYMKNKTKLSVKMLVVALTVIIAISCFTTACQPMSIINAEDNTSKDLPLTALSTEENKTNQENEKYNAPDSWQLTESIGANFTINIDAKVIMPDIVTFTVNKLERKELTQQLADKLIRYFAPDTKFYAHTVLTKADYEQQLIEARRGQDVDGKYVITEDSKAWVKELEERKKNAPETYTPQEIGTEFTYLSNYYGIDESQGKNFIILEFLTKNRNEASIYVQKYEEGAQRYEGMGNNNYFGYSVSLNCLPQSFLENYGMPENMTFISAEERQIEANVKKIVDSGFFNFDYTQEQAISQANKALADLNIDGMKLAGIEKGALEKYCEAGFSNVDAYEPAYILTYTRHLGEIGGLADQNFGRSSSNRKNENNGLEYFPPFYMENITMTVSKGGIQSFYWRDMAQFVENVSENSSKLLPFDEVQERILDQIKFTYSPEPSEDSHWLDIDIHTVRLNSSYINVNNELDVVLQVPAWVVEGKITHKYADGTQHGDDIMYIVINALDGGIIHNNRFTQQLSAMNE